MLLTIILATFLSGVISLAGAFLLAKKGTWKESFSLQLTAFASGVMLTTALLHLAPEAVHEGLSIDNVFVTIFIGIISLFVLERLVFWFHHHHESHGPKPSVWLITLGDTLHNFIDGVAIAAAFMSDIRLGAVTTLAVGLHEIPQEIADFITLIRGGVSSRRALLLNIGSSLSAVVGGVVTFLVRDAIDPVIPFVIAFSSGMFLYIALSDLIPELHHHTKNNSEKWKQLGWLFLGIFLMFGVTRLVDGQLHGEEHQEEVHLEEIHDDEEDLDHE